MKKARGKQATNVFHALGFSPSEAENLRLRSALMNTLIEEIERRKLTQAQAAKHMGVTQPRVSDLMRGKLHLFSLDTLVILLTAMGLKVELRIRKAA